MKEPFITPTVSHQDLIDAQATKIKILEKKLSIAKKALEFYSISLRGCVHNDGVEIHSYLDLRAKEALIEIDSI